MIALEFKEHAGRLTPADRALAEHICATVDVELHALLPALVDTVHVRIETGSRVIPQTGYGARAVTSHSVTFTVDPQRPEGTSKLLETDLRPALFHECHHLVRGWVLRGGKRRKHFIEGVICEGLATAFERDAAGHPPPWANYPDDVQAWVEQLLQLPAYAPCKKWMFRHPDGRLWIGYRAGTFIADRAIAASGRSAAEFAETDYAEILKLV